MFPNPAPRRTRGTACTPVRSGVRGGETFRGASVPSRPRDRRQRRRLHPGRVRVLHCGAGASFSLLLLFALRRVVAHGADCGVHRRENRPLIPYVFLLYRGTSVRRILPNTHHSGLGERLPVGVRATFVFGVDGSGWLTKETPVVTGKKSQNMCSKQHKLSTGG